MKGEREREGDKENRKRDGCEKGIDKGGGKEREDCVEEKGKAQYER